MNLKKVSIFNLIEIFGQNRKKEIPRIDASAHCEQKHHHDFYCDTEKPFVAV